MLRKVFICGAHSTGKTTLFESLKKQLQIQNVKLIYFPEVARKLAVEKNFKAVGLVLYIIYETFKVTKLI